MALTKEGKAEKWKKKQEAKAAGTTPKHNKIRCPPVEDWISRTSIEDLENSEYKRS